MVIDIKSDIGKTTSATSPGSAGLNKPGSVHKISDSYDD